MTAGRGEPPAAAERRSPLRVALFGLLGAAIAAAVVVSILLNLPVRPPTGLTSPSGAAAAPNIRTVVTGSVRTLAPATALRGRRAVTTDFLDPSTGWAIVGCGAQAPGATASASTPAPCSVVATTDGGLSWRPLWTTSAQLVGIAFPTRQDGYAWTGAGACAAAACPTRLYATSDGGRTWTRRFVGAAVWSGVAVTGPSTLWAAVGGLLLVSTDGGRVWRIVQTPGCIAENVRFQGASGVVVGRGGEGLCALRTTDGGGAWRPLLTGLDAPAVRGAFDRFIADTGLSSVLGGPAAVRIDCVGGQAWPEGAGAVWLVVRCDPINPQMLAVLHTSDGGAHWRLAWDTAGCTGACPAQGLGEEPLGFAGAMAWRTAPGAVATAPSVGATFYRGGRLCARAACTPSLDVLGPTRAVAATGQGLFATLDGGARWQRIWPGAGPGPLAAISLVAADTGVAVPALDPGRLLTTTDGGRGWRVGPSLPNGVQASLVDFVSARQGYVYGTHSGHPVLLYTGDGGRAFHPVPLPSSAGGALALSQITFRTATAGLALDVFGDGWRTGDGGVRWRLIGPMPLGLPQAAAWAGPRTLFALVAFKPAGSTAGRSGHFGLVASADDGAQFRPLAAWPWPPAQGNFDSAVFAAHGTNLWLFAYDGMLASADGGGLWTLVRLPPSRLDPAALAFADARSGWLLTTRGVLFRTSDGGTVWRQVTRAG